MLKSSKYFRILLICIASLILQSCTFPIYWFMVTNTASGNVCVEDFELSAVDPYAQKVSKILYARYGENGGEKFMFSNTDTSFYRCDRADLSSIGAPKSNLIISVEFYKNVIEPEYLGINTNPSVQQF